MKVDFIDEPVSYSQEGEADWSAAEERNLFSAVAVRKRIVTHAFGKA
jgi:hypothetical protein